MGTTLRRLSALNPNTLALMHGPSCSGDGGKAFRDLAHSYDRRISDALKVELLSAPPEELIPIAGDVAP